MVRTFKISAREVKQEKNSFIACSTKVGNSYFKIKFTKDCITQPRKRGLYDLTIDTNKCSIENGKKYINKQGFEAIGQPTIWVKEAITLRAYTEEELAKINDEKFAQAFAEAEDSEYEPLPF